MAVCALLLAACGKEEAATNEAAATAPAPAESDMIVFADGARDRLCLKGGQVAFITYARAGNANCTLRGTLANGRIQPDGDGACTIAFARTGDRATLGAAGPACAYYCGPDVSFTDKSFTRLPSPEPVTDLAGDPLC
ncbi:hypothetical protein OMW55_03145 [Sphingomonas sp. BN140010]|uniref:Lipoprotein n=1 Tax=Sphingomonas arvum TaxID=2992113 RepID=A0ABT3JCN6_9SPHN|nr:hypothetical protein [Sphingomonas sp. BN140010]MCW3796801.1 hypothetical protein [Sphingomonas sp. BN140010]